MAENTNLQGKRILIFQQRGWGMRVGHFLAKKLQAEGCTLGAVTLKRSVHNFVVEQKEVQYELITSYDDIMDDPQGYLGKDDYSLSEICNDLNIDSIWPYVQALRHHARSYKEKYYYSYRQEASDEEIIAFVKATYKNVRYVFEKFKPDVILAPNIVSLFHIFYDLYGKKLNVKMVRIMDSRVRGIGILVEGYKSEEGRFFGRFKELENGAMSPHIDMAKEYIQKTREVLQVPIYSDFHNVHLYKKSFIKKIREELSPYRKIYNFFFQKNVNRLKKFPVAIDYKSPYYILRDHYAHKFNIWQSNRFHYEDFTKIKKYIYFPLQFTPEETIDVAGARFNNQIETIRQIAMSAPGDYTIVVKEHPAMLGRRSRSYLEKISRTPNVKLVDYRIPSEQIIRSADLVINISGTSLAEAAFLKKPAIQLGNLGVIQILPNIFFHTDFINLSGKIQEALKARFDTPEYERKLVHFVAATYDVGSDADYVGIWWGKTTEKMEELWQMYCDELQYILNSTPNKQHTTL